MRYRWVDVYRGIAVLFMVVLHFFVDIFPEQPIPFLEYSNRGVISIGDMALALFLFISGVSTYLSISKSKLSKDEAIRHVLIRYSRIFVMGLLLDVVLIASIGKVWWVLEAIGLSGLIAMFFICFSQRMKVLMIAVMGACYSYLISSPYIYNLVSQFPNGGLLGSIQLSGIVLVGYMAGEHITKKKEKSLPLLLALGLLLILMGFILNQLMLYDRGVGTLPYIVLSSGFCILLTVPVYWLFELKRVSSAMLEDVGKSALLIFVLNYPVLFLAFSLSINNSFNTGQSALITLFLISLLVIASELYVQFNEL
jgi:predicted acyltransferase